ncbi:site-specific integrase [Listeria ilorinensis]|uniref:site-specific integrase n=1 Tax=Listeria ilorinensis TaxID=2867439 RepID=UPI001EF4294A|nr:site-specific integrase [Listeria ilorinensis]
MARKKKILFCEYYEEWIETYKVDAVAGVTLKKYYITLKHLKDICPNLYVSDLDRRTYQKIINEYAKTHEKQTTMDFHHQVKACIQDLFHDRLIEIDPTYKCVIKGMSPKQNKRKKFLQKDELANLIKALDLSEVNKDWFLLIVAKTGLRYAEALALTPADFDWTNNLLTVNKTWDYKNNSGFSKTKTTSSMRVIAIDWQIVGQFQPLIANLPENEPIFIEKLGANSYKRQFNSTINNYLLSKCRKLEITEISLHALRHTHASVLLAAGVSIHTISARLGHADVGVTQETYAHVLDDLQRKDDQKMLSALMQLSQEV